MIIVLSGKPSSGKGTQSNYIIEEFNAIHVSLGNIRKENNNNPEFEIKYGKYISKGSLFPDEIAMEMLYGKLNKILSKDVNIVLDGYPRTIIQAEGLDKYLSLKGYKIDIVINLEVSDEKIIERSINRRICSNPNCKAIYNLKNNLPKIEGICDLCGSTLIKRDDDTLELIQKRLEIYDKETKPILDYYEKGKILFNVDGEKNLNKTKKDIKEELERKERSKKE